MTDITLASAPPRAASAAPAAGASGGLFKASLVAAPIVLAAIALVAPALMGAGRDGEGRSLAFVALCVLTTAELLAIGYAVSGRISGVIIDARDCMSLSKLQMCGWTVLVISALAVAASSNLRFGVGAPLAVTIPPELLIAMGISATSLVAAPALLGLKSGQSAPPEALDAAARRLGLANVADVPNTGAVMGNATVKDASLLDLVTGDDVSNFDSADLGKVQQLLVTLLLLGLYGAYVFAAFGAAGPVKALPGIDRGFIWLMAVSHASYLAYKAAPHPTTS